MNQFTNVLVGVDLASGDRLVAGFDDLAPGCRAAIDRAAWVARKFGASLHVLASLDVDAFAEDLIRRQQAAQGDSVLDEAQHALAAVIEGQRAAGLRITSEVTFGRPARSLVEDVERSARDLVVIGTRPTGGATRRRTSLALLRHCPVPVWFARTSDSVELEQVVVAVDHGPEAAEIVDLAATVARVAGARLDVLHVVDESSERVLRAAGGETVDAYRRARRAPGDAALERLVAHASGLGVVAKGDLRTGDPADVIVKVADELRPGTVVLGTRVHGGVQATIWGSVAEQVLSQIRTSLLVVKHVSA